MKRNSLFSLLWSRPSRAPLRVRPAREAAGRQPSTSRVSSGRLLPARQLLSVLELRTSRVTAVFTVSPSGEELKGEGTAIPGVRKTVLTGPAAACEQGSTRFPPTSFDLGLVGVFCFFDLVINSFSIIQDETKGKNKEERKKTSHHIKGCWLHRSFFTLKY